MYEEAVQSVAREIRDNLQKLTSVTVARTGINEITISDNGAVVNTVRVEREPFTPPKGRSPCMDAAIKFVLEGNRRDSHPVLHAIRSLFPYGNHHNLAHMLSRGASSAFLLPKLSRHSFSNWNLCGTSLVSPETRDVYRQELIHEALERAEVRLELSRVIDEVRNSLRKELFLISGRKEEYKQGVAILGRAPLDAELVMIRLMSAQIEALSDTPIVMMPAIQDHLGDIRKRLYPHTANEAIARAVRSAPSRITRRARDYFDPGRVLLPRHWRWLVKQKGRVVLRLRGTGCGPMAVALAADYFPESPVKNLDLITVASRVLMRQEGISPGNLPVIVDVFMTAVAKARENTSKHKLRPYMSHATQQRMLTRLLVSDLKVDNDLRRASLKRLYDITRELHDLEPDDSLQHGRFDVSHLFPEGREFGGLTFEPLDTHVKIYEESQEMGHCLFRSWCQHLREGRYLGYSVQNGAHRWTLLLTRNVQQKRYEYYTMATLHNGLPLTNALESAHEFAGSLEWRE